LRPEPAHLAAPDIVELQRTVGNRAVSSLLRSATAREKADAADVAYWDDAFRLARRRIAAQQYAEAEELLQRVYEDPKFRSSDSPGVLLNLALCRQARGDYKGAISLYQEAMSSPNWTPENRGEIVEEMRKARLRQPVAGRVAPAKPDAADVAYWDDAFRLARRRIAAQQFAEAGELLLRVYEDPKFRSSESPGVLLNLALCQQARGDYERAISLYVEAVASPNWSEENRRDIVAEMRKARLRQPVQGRVAPAKGDAADEAYWDDAFRLARKRIAAQQFAEAEELLQRMYEEPKFRSSDSPGVLVNLALCRQARGDFEGAISLYEEALWSRNWNEEKRRTILDNVRAARLHQPPGTTSGH